jgi:hypothetical protein
MIENLISSPPNEPIRKKRVSTGLPLLTQQFNVGIDKEDVKTYSENERKLMSIKHK